MDGSGHSVCMPGLYADGAAVYLGDHRGITAQVNIPLA
jgi:hypothetical protein